jgi:hypothetical protein
MRQRKGRGEEERGEKDGERGKRRQRREGDRLILLLDIHSHNNGISPFMKAEAL